MVDYQYVVVVDVVVDYSHDYHHHDYHHHHDYDSYSSHDSHFHEPLVPRARPVPRVSLPAYQADQK